MNPIDAINVNGGGQGNSLSQSNVVSNNQASALCVLKKIVIVHQTNNPGTHRNQQKQHSRELPIQTLGKLLYSIYSNVGLTPLSTVSPTGDDWNEASLSRKRAKVTDTTTTLSQLVETKLYPLSICRLLSDMLSSASTPFESFHEILEDLEQMVSCPARFLHDSYFPYSHPPRPIFGNKHYGRKSEIAHILDQMNTNTHNLSSVFFIRECR